MKTKVKTPQGQPAPPATKVLATRSTRELALVETVHAPALVVARGTIASVDDRGLATFTTTFGHRCSARLSQAIDPDWLVAALVSGPVQAEGTVASDGTGSIWALFPGPEHAAVQVDHRRIGAASSLSLTCGDSQIQLSSSGRIEIRGREVIARGSRVTRLQGGSIRLG